MQFKTSTVEYVVLATCALHNYLRNEVMLEFLGDQDDSDDPMTEPPTVSVSHNPRTTGGKYNVEVKKIRDTLASYFVGIGQIINQWKHANL